MKLPGYLNRWKNGAVSPAFVQQLTAADTSYNLAAGVADVQERLDINSIELRRARREAQQRVPPQKARYFIV